MEIISGSTTTGSSELPREIYNLYLEYPNRSDFLPYQLNQDILKFLVGSDEGIKKAQSLANYLGVSSEIKFVERERLVDVSDKLVKVYDFGRPKKERRYSEVYLPEEAENNEDLISKLLNHLLTEAIRLDANAIHIEPRGADILIRFRIDGVLHTINTLKAGLLEELIQRLKVISGIEDLEGSLCIQSSKGQKDIHISIARTITGDKIIMRFINREVIGIQSLGMTNLQLQRLGRALKSGGGVILVHGSGESGKSSTIYAILKECIKRGLDIVTVETDIRQRLEGVTQIVANGSSTIRNLINQDPDVVVIDELRDESSIIAAFETARSGKLVIAAMNARSSSEAIARLIEMNIEPLTIANNLLLVIGQRLIRRNCPKCKKELPMDNGALKIFSKQAFSEFSSFLPDKELEAKLSEVYAGSVSAVKKTYHAGSGCPFCLKTGFRTRRGIFEVIAVENGLKKLIMNRADESGIERQIRLMSSQTMLSNGLTLAAQGETTPQEVVRVLEV